MKLKEKLLDLGEHIIANADVLTHFFKKNAVLCISALAALVTVFFVPIDGQYIDYFDFDTLICLFCILAVVMAFRGTGVFERLAHALVRHLSSPASATLVLVLTTAIASMFCTNDMALVMMLPLAAATLARGDWIHLLPVVFVLEGLAANLCGMITPFGNPQNLFLYSYYGIDLQGFALTMLPPFICSVALLMASILVFIPKTRRSMEDEEAQGEKKGSSEKVTEPVSQDLNTRSFHIAIYSALLLLAILAVFRVIPTWIALILTIIVLAVLDRTALKKTDYALLLTFAFFFVFAGNMARIPEVCDSISWLLDKNALLVSAGLSQVISNVPAAVLLSHFTANWSAVLAGVNIGGAGTLVGSLASLITLQHFTAVSRMYKIDPQMCQALSNKRFVAIFSAFNFAYLIVLVVVCTLFAA